MAKTGDVDLIIRAKNDASKALDSITSSLKSLKDQQVIAGTSAEKMDGQLSALSLELQKLRTNAQNMQQLANVATVVDKASAALERQRDAAAGAASEQQKLINQQQKLQTQQSELAGGLKAANTELEKQKTATQTAKASLAELNKEATALATTERNTQRSLDAVTRLIQTQEKTLGEATEKHAALAKAVAETEKPTKRLTASLEAAERALAKRQAALDASRAKEAGLQETLLATATAQEANVAAIQKGNTALTEQQKVAATAQANVQKLTAESSSLAKSQQAVEREITKSTAVMDGLKAGLDQAESEYKQLEDAADQARAAVGQTAAVTTSAGQAAVQAAAQLATFAARAKVLQGGSGKSSTTSIGLNPDEVTAATSALKQAQAVVQATEREYSRAAVSAEDLQNAITATGKAGETLKTVSTAVTQQRTAIDGAQASWKEAEAEVRRLAIAMREADQPTEALAAAFGNAQGQARLAKTEFQNQQRIGDQLAQSLEKAGVGASTLQSAEASLTGAVRSAADTMTRASSATQQLNQAQTGAEQSGSRLGNLFRNLSQTGGNVAGALGNAAAGIAKIRSGAASATGPIGSLSSELKSLAAQAVGLYAIKEGIEGIIRTSNQFDAVRAQIGVAFAGDVQKSAQAMDFATTVAKNLKLPILETAKGYAQLAAAARGTSMEGEEVNKTFVAFAQAARVTRTSAADLDGIFRALTQSISKGKVQAEELRGQLGDRFPGALQIMAQALGVSTQELDKMLEAGALTTDTLVRMAAEVSKRVAPELDNALQSPQAKLQAFQNSWTELQLKMAQSGFLDAIATAAERLGEALASPATIQGVTDLGQGLASLVTWLTNLEDPLGKAKLGLEVLVGLQLASWIGGAVSGFASMVAGLYGLATAAAAADIALAPILLVIGGIALALATPFVAMWAYDNFPTFAKLCLEMQGVVQNVWSYIKEAWDITGAALGNSFEQVINNITSMWRSMLSWLANTSGAIFDKIGLSGLKEAWQKEAEDAAAKANATAEASQREHEAEISGIHRKAQEERAANDAAIALKIQDKLTEIARKGEAERAKTAVVPAVTPTGPGPGPGVGTGQVTPPSGPFKPDSSKADAAAAKKRLALEQRVADQISSIQSRLDMNKANSLDQQIAGVEEKYRGLYDDLRKLGLSENSEQWKTVDALKAQEIQLVKNKAAKAASVAQAKQEKDAQQNINDMLALRKDYIDQIKYAESKGDYTTADTLKQKYNELNEQIRQAIDSQIAYWQAAGGPGADLAIAKLQAQKDSLNNVKETSILTAQTIGTQFGQSLSSFGDNFLTLLSQTGDIFGSLRESFLQFASSFLLEMAKMILKQQLFNALQAASKSGGIFGTIFGAAAASVGSAHTGGLAGSPGLNQRSVNPAVFAGAMKYHTGGVVGLQPWEVPIIAKKNEEVLTEDDPRHISNLGAGGDSTNGGNGNSSMPNFQIINAIDADEVVQRGLSSPAGTKVVMNLIQSNRTKIKGLIGG